MNLRLIAAHIIVKVSAGHSLTDCLRSSLPPLKDPRDSAFVRAVTYGVCRYYSSLDVLLSYLLKKPMKAKESDVHALLLVGLYQLKYMSIPPHAAVAETVNAIATLKKPWAKGLVNAVLREYLRQHEKLEEKISTHVEALYAHPLWWINSIKKAWPHDWQSILAANNAHPPLSLRINSQLMRRDDYLRKSWNIKSTMSMIPETESGIVMDPPVPVEDIPGFSTGLVSVQDGAAQLAAKLLLLAPNQRVLDACAAPGGKLTHILETEPNLSACISVEKDKQRILSIKENLTRLKLQATCICDDVSQTKDWWDGQRFDRILLDAPCSASGVIRRHPDIKLLRHPSDIKLLAETQYHLLEALWPLLKPKGLLVYATCSIFPAENAQVLERFLSAHADAVEEKIQASWGVPCQIGRQILPGMHNMDGFYYACLRK